MKYLINRALLGALVALIVLPVAADAAPLVSVRVEGAKRTLLSSARVRPHSGSIRTGGTPAGACPALSAAGALDVATHHRWGGKFFASVGGIFITSIFGEKPKGNDYWTVFVNNRSSSLGICQIRPRRGQQLLFAVTNGTQVPLVLRGPHRARLGQTVTVTAGSFGKSGFVGAANVHVRGAGVNATSDRSGHVQIRIAHTGTLVLRGDGTGFVRAAALRITELP